MKTIFLIVLFMITLCLVSEAVQIQDGEYSFSIESVKVLQNLLDSSSFTKQQNTRLLQTSSAAVCDNPTLPQEFLGLCQKSGSGRVFSKLAKVPLDLCEICAFAACTGC